MTLPANIRVNVGVPFPARVAGAGFISVLKKNGVWTIAPDYPLLAPLAAVSDPTQNEFVVYNILTGQYLTVTLAQLIGIATNTYRVITAAGDVNVLASDSTILINKAAGAATNINLPTSISRNGVPVKVKDYKGDAAAHNITFVPSGVETIDGFSAVTAAANGIALIDINYGNKTLFPLTSGGWYL
jgi:hypothetical protein